MDNAELYKNYNELQKKDAQFFLNKYASKLNWKIMCNKILDIGCGDGSVTNMLKSRIPAGYEYKITGIDISERMVKYANDHHRDHNTSFSVLDIADNIPQELVGNFDHVFSNYTLHWVIDQEVAFKNIYRVLSPGGECLLIFLAATRVFDIYVKMKNMHKWSTLITDTDQYTSPYHFVQEPDKKLSHLMVDVGFVDIEIEYKDSCHVYENMDVGRKALYSVCPFNRSDDLNEEFMNDYMAVAREFGFIHVPGDGLPETIKLDYSILVAFARKPTMNSLF